MTFRISVLLAALATSNAHASLIIDSAVESANGWTAAAGFAPTQGFLSPQEGTELALIPYSFFGTNISSPLLGGTLAAGTYTVQFAVGSDNSPFMQPFGLVFAGVFPTSQSTPTPTIGSWALWTAQYVIPLGDPNIGNPHQFIATLFADFGTQGAFDGVGSLSTDGNGFLVDFVAAVPEASEALVAMCGSAGLLLGSRRRNPGSADGPSAPRRARGGRPRQLNHQPVTPASSV